MTIGSSIWTSSLFLSDNPSTQRPNAIQALGNALSAGDLASSKRAYQALTARVEQSDAAWTSSVFHSAVSDLGQALDSGDLLGAKTAFSKINQTVAPAKAGSSGDGSLELGSIFMFPGVFEARTFDSSSSTSAPGSLNLYA